MTVCNVRNVIHGKELLITVNRNHLSTLMFKWKYSLEHYTYYMVGFKH